MRVLKDTLISPDKYSNEYSLLLFSAQTFLRQASVKSYKNMSFIIQLKLSKHKNKLLQTELTSQSNDRKTAERIRPFHLHEKIAASEKAWFWIILPHSGK